MFGPPVSGYNQDVRQVPGDRVSSEPSKRHDHRLSVCYGTCGTACQGGSLLRSCYLLSFEFVSFLVLTLIDYHTLYHSQDY